MFTSVTHCDTQNTIQSVYFIMKHNNVSVQNAYSHFVDYIVYWTADRFSEKINKVFDMLFSTSAYLIVRKIGGHM